MIRMPRRLAVSLGIVAALCWSLPGSAQVLRVTQLQRAPIAGEEASSSLFHPIAVATDSSGALYISDCANHAIRKVTPDGVMTTLAGRPGVAGSADGRGSAARFNFPYGLAVDINGDVYVADSANSTIRRITPGGEVTTFAGVAGESGAEDWTEEATEVARLGMPIGLTIDAIGNVYVSDARFHTIRKIDRQGRITTIAGNAGRPGESDGYRTAASFNFPFDLAFDRGGNLWVTDSNSHTIRRITPDGRVTTEFGVAGTAGSADGDAETARFNRPAGIAFDDDGDLFVVDANSHTVRRIDASRQVTTVAGTAGVSGRRDGIGADVQFFYPFGITARDGTLWVADKMNHEIRVGTETAFGERRRAVRR